MLPRHLRLPARIIPLLAYKGKKTIGENIEIRFAADAGLEFPLLAITVTTKVSKNAVKRNRIRRALKVKIEELAAANKIAKGRYIILLRTAFAAEKEAELPRQLEQLLSKVV